MKTSAIRRGAQAGGRPALDLHAQHLRTRRPATARAAGAALHHGQPASDGDLPVPPLPRHPSAGPSARAARTRPTSQRPWIRGSAGHGDSGQPGGDVCARHRGVLQHHLVGVQVRVDGARGEHLPLGQRPHVQRARAQPG
ncbi:hypothetical protein Krad_2838 [Kineococcus radiotolerans SRS30216 = ATCC BAA-149]|uniref:Uncharacterized protein n=1 Tax=Kineococcus radiotolerans (strain ATCC BAA-149 / DSM 14245 / SRS30216) TaxID=266940 RepID=A6WBW7_KINRD|nr:hypothetical protein Krad_2838 [Kineococcus radiotolerans SRS30216 = ATCC BAA-149]